MWTNQWPCNGPLTRAQFLFRLFLDNHNTCSPVVGMLVYTQIPLPNGASLAMPIAGSPNDSSHSSLDCSVRTMASSVLEPDFQMGGGVGWGPARFLLFLPRFQESGKCDLATKNFVFLEHIGDLLGQQRSMLESSWWGCFPKPGSWVRVWLCVCEMWVWVSFTRRT